MGSPPNWPIHERLRAMELGQWKDFDSRTLAEMTANMIFELKEENGVIRKRLWGNGNIGLISEVRDNTRDIKMAKWVISIIFIAVIGAIVQIYIGK